MTDDTASPLPSPCRVVTTHKEGQSIVQKSDHVRFQPYGTSKSRFGDVWAFDSVPTDDNNTSYANFASSSCLIFTVTIDALAESTVQIVR